MNDFSIVEKMIVYIVGFSLLAILVLLRVFVINKRSILSAYNYSKLRISRKHLFRYWILMQIAGIICFKSMIDIILFPILIICFLLVYVICGVNEKLPNTDEYKDYEKTVKRDRKIEKILE